MDYFFYLGSSTIPPCSNGRLNWVVSNKIFKMSKKQRAFFDNRYNNPQKVNGNWRDIVDLLQNKVAFSTIQSLA
jgi:carbonic anhydrase